MIMDIFFNSFSNQVFLWLVKNKHLVIKLFFLAHILKAINILTAAFFVARIADGNEIGVLFYDLGGKFGTLAALAFLVTTTPGIAKRFGIRHPVFNIVQTFRRHFGIATFLLTFTHYAVLRLVPMMTWQSFSLPPFRETLGFFAFCLFFVMFITSNDLSMKRLGKWWGRLHSVAYVIIWLVFAHVALEEIGLLTLLLGVYAITEWVSLIYFWTKKKPLIPANVGPTLVSPSSSTPNTAVATPTRNQI